MLMRRKRGRGGRNEKQHTQKQTLIQRNSQQSGLVSSREGQESNQSNPSPPLLHSYGNSQKKRREERE